MKTFEAALQGLREGKMITRLLWGSQAFVFRQVPSRVPAEIIPKMTSLPLSVKALLAQDWPESSLVYWNQLAKVTAPDEKTVVIQSWSPAISDLFATDWFILGEEEVAAAVPVVAGETVGTATPLE
jgi:hypothetical protein